MFKHLYELSKSGKMTEMKGWLERHSREEKTGNPVSGAEHQQLEDDDNGTIPSDENNTTEHSIIDTTKKFQPTVKLEEDGDMPIYGFDCKILSNDPEDR